MVNSYTVFCINTPASCKRKRPFQGLNARFVALIQNTNVSKKMIYLGDEK